MTPHGPDTRTYEIALHEEQTQLPQRLPDSTLAFMFEAHMTPRVTAAALGSACIDQSYYRCWVGLQSHYTGPLGPSTTVRDDGAEVDAQ